MGYHANVPITSAQQNTNTSENDVISDIQYPIAPQSGKYFLVTGKDPMCRKFC